MALTPEDQKYFETYFELFASDGWKQLAEEVIQGISSLGTQTMDQDDEKVFHFNRGYRAALRYILAYEGLVHQAYEDQTEDEGADDAFV